MRRLFVLVGCLLMLGVVISGCSSADSEAKSMEQLHQEKGVPVRVERIEIKPMIVEYAYHAVLSGIQESHASALVSDRVEKIYYAVGEYINKDDVVLSFPTDNPAAQYYQAKGNFEHAETTLKRMENLYESGGISLQDLDGVRAQYKVAQANWDAVRQSVKVKAPICGILTSLDVHESDNVQPGDVLFTVSQTKKLKAKLWVPESQIIGLTAGTKAIAKWNNFEIPGRVTQVDQSLNSSMQAFGLDVEFDNAENCMISGVNAEIKLSIELGSNAIVVERKNLVKENDTYFVYTLENSAARKQAVEIGTQFGTAVEVVQGLHAGDILITEGQTMLDDGKKVKVVNNQ